MRLVSKLLLPALLLSCGSAAVGQGVPTQAEAGMTPLTPRQAVEQAADLAPEGVPGVFDFRVRATGAEGPRVFFNSEQDYRDPRNLTLVISPAAYAGLAVRLDQDPRQALVGKQLLVTGVARRVTIFFAVNGKRTDKYYYQTHVDVNDAAQIVVVDSAAGPATPVATPDVVLPPGTGLGRRSPSDLTVAWWQWAMASPGPSDMTGEHCAVNQDGDVWFLAGGYGSERIHRRCRIPAGKHIFLPIVTSVTFPKRPDSGYTCETAKADVAQANEGSLDLYATVDGQSVAMPAAYRVKTAECFDIHARMPADAGAYRAYPAATEGFWLRLKPLAKGPPNLTCGRRRLNTKTGNNRHVQDITYDLVVE